MADIMLHTSTSKQVTCVSNIFIDTFMIDANGEYVKIYLYLLRCLTQEHPDFSISTMAEKLDHTQRDIKLALNYWEERHLLRLEYDKTDELVGICLLDPSVNSMEGTPSATPMVCTSLLEEKQIPVPHELPQKHNYSPDEMLVFEQNSNLSDILFEAESYLGRTLTATDLNTIFYWYDGLHMSPDFISYLLETCIEQHHSSLKYMNSIALDWATKGITNPKQASLDSSVYSKLYFGVMKCLGISNRNLTKVEKNYIDKWSNTYCFSDEIIFEACNRTILNTQKANFKYTDKILSSWHASDVRSLADLIKVDADFASSKTSAKTPTRKDSAIHNFDERSYNFNDIEQRLLQK